MRRLRIIVDPGHGGTNPGCQYPGLSEKTYTLEMAGRLAPALARAGHIVALTRDADETTGFAKRAGRAKAFLADVVICLHVNANVDPAPRGQQVYHMPDDELARRLAIALYANAPASCRTGKWAGVKVASLDGKGDDAVLRRFAMPAALVELAFASNPSDREYLLSADGQDCLTRGIVAGVNRYACDLPVDEETAIP